MTSIKTHPPVCTWGVVFYPCMTSASWPLPASLLTEDVVVMTTFSREINVPPSLGACVMACFGQGSVFIWILAWGGPDDFCDLGIQVPKLELAGCWTGQLLALQLLRARFWAGAAPLWQCCWSQGQIPESQQRRLLQIVSRGLILLVHYQRGRLWDVLPEGSPGKGFLVLAHRGLECSPRGAGPSSSSSS